MTTFDDLFAAAARQGERGIQVAAYLGEELVVDEWFGTRDADDRVPVEADTLFQTWSLGKSLSALAVHIQVTRGLLDFDAPIADVWPEFAVHGKDHATLRHAITHRLGIPQMPTGVDAERIGDWAWMTENIADLEPISPPGEQSTYLAMTYGWVLGELVRRTDPNDRTFSDFVRDEILVPLDITDIHFGVTDADLGRVAHLSADGPPSKRPDDDSLWSRAMPGVVALEPAVFNQPAVLLTDALPAGALANARSEARLWAMFANGGSLDGVRLLPEATVRALAQPRERPDERDPVLGDVIGFGAYGFWLGDTPRLARMVGNRRTILAQPSAGGALGWADLETGLAVSICHNRMVAAARGDDSPLVAIADHVREVSNVGAP